MIPEVFGRVGILFLLALSFPMLPIMVSYLLYRLKVRPEVPNPVKYATYECGVEAEGSSWGQFNARYYLFALGFVIFDVEVISSVVLSLWCMLQPLLFLEKCRP